MRWREEAGSGLVSTLAGVIAFLFFLMLAAQVLVHLFATSYVTAAAFDAARMASAEGDVGAPAARAHGLGLLGGLAQRVSAFEVAVGAQDVTVHVRATSPALVPALLARRDIATIDRTVTVRREVVPCAGC